MEKLPNKESKNSVTDEKLKLRKLHKQSYGYITDALAKDEEGGIVFIVPCQSCKNLLKINCCSEYAEKSSIELKKLI